MSNPNEQPTRARYTVAIWLCCLSLLLYLDRICISQAVPSIMDEFDITKTQISYALMSFTLAYGLFAVPGGMLGDRIGPRVVLSLLVAAWSIFTALTGLVGGLLALVVVRFFFGASEAGAFPNTARIISHWFPVRERGRIQGLMLSFAQVGGLSAPIITAQIIEGFGWRWMFISYAIIGLLWSIFFYGWFRDDPSTHRRVNAAEVEDIRLGSPPPPLKPGPVPWKHVAVNRGLLTLALLQVLGSFFTYFFYTWFPTYLQEARGVEDVKSGWLNTLAIGGSAVGQLFGGWAADRITRHSADPVRSRRHLCMAGFLVAAACMFLGTRSQDALGTALFWAAAMAFMHIQLPNWWCMIIPQAGRHTATLFGLANGLGVLGALTSQGFVGIFADYQQQARGLTGRAAWDPMFDVYTLVLVGGAVAWWFYRFIPLPETSETATPRPNGEPS